MNLFTNLNRKKNKQTDGTSHMAVRYCTQVQYSTPQVLLRSTVRAFCEAFNSVGAIISPLQNMGSLEKAVLD